MESKKNIKTLTFEINNLLNGKIAFDHYYEFIISGIYVRYIEKEIIKEYYGEIKSYDYALEKLKLFDEQLIYSFNRLLDGISYEEIDELIHYTINYNFDRGRIFENSNNTLNKLAIELLKLQSGDIVFDLGSGLGSFLIDTLRYSLDKRMVLKDIIGIDYNTEYVHLANMALKCLSRNLITPIIRYGNALEKIDYPYNKGFVYPPLGMKQNSMDKNISSKLFEYKFSTRNSIEWIFIDRLLSKISGDTRAVALIPLKPLYNDADKEYRNLLLEKGLIEGIIELPNGALEYSGIKMCLMVFSKKNYSVKILDATNFLSGATTRFSKINIQYQEIVKHYFSKSCESRTNEDLIKLNNITPSNLAIKVEKIKNGILLSSVAKVFTGSQYTIRNFQDRFSHECTGYKILTSSDINNGNVEWDELQSFINEDKKIDKYAVQKNDIILTSKSTKVKTVVVDIDPEEKIIVTGGMLIVRPNPDMLDSTYFKIYIDSENGINTLKSIQKGSIIVTINAKDLSNIVIPNATIEKQKKMSKKYNNMLSTLIAYKKELENLENKLSNFFLDEIEDE